MPASCQSSKVLASGTSLVETGSIALSSGEQSPFVIEAVDARSDERPLWSGQHSSRRLFLDLRLPHVPEQREPALQNAGDVVAHGNRLKVFAQRDVWNQLPHFGL